MSEKRQRMSRNRVTISDVARRAKVSPMTVSRTFNTPAQVSPDLRDSVMRAVKDLGYIQNRLAGALASTRSGVVAIVIPSLTNNVFLALTNAIHAVVEQRGYQPLITVTDYSLEKEKTAVGNILSWSPDGLVLVGLDHARGLRKMIQGSRIPVVETVQIGRAAIDMNVGVNHKEAGRLMGRHLISRGFESIWMLGARESSDSRVVQRFEGCGEALEEAGLRSDLVRRLPVDDSLSFGYRAVSMVAEAGHQRPAIFFGNDLMAIGALKATRQMSLSVPKDIGIAGFNGIELADYVDPRLTTIRVPYVEMGRMAAELLLSEIEGLPITLKRVELAPQLVEGGST